MSSPSLVQSCLWTVTRWVPLVQQKLLTFITANECTQPCSILSEVSAALGAPIVSLLKDKIEQGWVNSCAVIKVRGFCCNRGAHRVIVQIPSYLYHSTWVHTALFNLVFEQWHDERPYCSRNLLPLSQHMSSLSLVQSCLWTMTKLLLHEGHPSCHCSKTRLNKAEWTDVLW
jgi:hypothetical protein